jgi:transcription-repair coupling factor (superfamily II helicase)
LLSIYASRKIEAWFSFEIQNDKMQIFQSHFPYVYTFDQQKAIEDVLGDMATQRNMDRLLVGDVGFGKTEVAFNALYNAFLNKKQALLISPLVVLAYEHYEKAKERFGPFGLKIGVLTRLESPKKVSETLKKIASWELDIIIWTHKVLSEKIQYKNLGLIVIDEEHKFWVEDKEKIKKMRINIDCLSLSATPIPRSLNMALSGIRDISLLREPPHGRKDIKTTVSKFDEGIIELACKKEFERGGQVFFIHNRVENIEAMKNILQKILPGKKIVITHGQLQGEQLENRILAFKRKEYDVLLSTTVIENGIDFSNVNTIFINECQSFGLSQIHQLRGRVGRSDREGYCYLFYKKENLADDTIKRLKTIVKYSYLGAWFEIAIKDLEIRGGGDILGIRQSGQATEIGINLFIELLEDKIEELKQEGIPFKKDNMDISIDLNISALIPESYFNGEIDKINFYREIEMIKDEQELNGVIEEFENINPDFPPETENLFDILKCKIQAKSFKITHIKRVWVNYELIFQNDLTVEELKKFLQLDKEVIFHIVSIDKIRTPKKSFENDNEFLNYLLKMFDSTLENKIPKKIKRKY